MIGLILVTHGRLAEEFIHAMEHVVGARRRTSRPCASARTTTWRRGATEIPKAIKQVDSGHGRDHPDRPVRRDAVEPRDLAAQVPGRTEVLAGINLPMLIRLAAARKSMDATGRGLAARDAGRNYIPSRRIPRAGRVIA